MSGTRWYSAILTDLKPAPYDHIVEPSSIKWNLLAENRAEDLDEHRGYPERHAGRGPGGEAVVGSRPLHGPGADRGHRAGQVHDVAAAAGPGAQRPGPARRSRPLPAG